MGSASLRGRAEAQLKQPQGEPAQSLAPENRLKLLHELQVHQLELEMKNEELRRAKAEIEAGLRRYTDLYDFAPVGYFTLAHDGAISHANLTGAEFIGIERSQLTNRRLAQFISEADRPAFNAFLKKVFAGKSHESCEVSLTETGPKSIVVRIEAVASPDGSECRAVFTDISALRQAEEKQCLSEESFRSLFMYSNDAILRFPNAPASGVISTSPFVHGQALPTPFENPAQRGYSHLKPGAVFTNLSKVPSMTGEDADLSHYPARRGFEDLVMMASDSSLPFAWTAVTLPKMRAVWFSLKDPRILRETVFWLSNGGAPL